MKKNFKLFLITLLIVSLLILLFSLGNRFFKNKSQSYFLKGLWVANGTIYPQIENDKTIEEVNEIAKESVYYIIFNEDKTFYAIFGEMIDIGNYSYISDNEIYLEFNNKDNIGTRCELLINNELKCNLYASKFQQIK